MSEFRTNSFQVPNVLIDEIMQNISGNALKCLLFIVRQTRGWHKTTDKISASIFMEKCGLSKHTVLSSIAELENIGVISRKKSSSQNGLNEYSLTEKFNLNSSAKNAPVQNLHGANSDDSSAKNALPSAKNALPAVQNLHPQNNNKNTTQKTNTKDSSATPEKRFDFRAELLSLGVSSDNADDWLIVRKNKNASNTKSALTMLVTQAGIAGVSVNDAVNFAAGMSWSGFKADWYGNARASPTKPTNGLHDGFEKRDYTAGINPDGSF